MPQAPSSSHSTTHTPAYAATSMSITHPTLIWAQVLEQKQLRKTSAKRSTLQQPDSSSAASVFSQSTACSYNKEQPERKPRSFPQKIRNFFSN